MKQKQLVIALGLTSSLGLVGCGGGSSSDGGSSGSTTSTYSVKAIDGYLNGALVWLDVDGDFLPGPTEPQTKSGAGGNATLDVTGIDNPEQYSVIVRAIKGETIDEDTNKPVAADYVMSAPAGQQTVTPLSTLVHVEMKRATTGTDEEKLAAAQTKIAGQLGIEEDDVLGDYIADDKDEAAAGAKALVTSGTMPSTPEELDQQADGTGSDDLLSDAETINQLVKTTIETKKSEAEEGQDPDLSTIIVSKDGTVDEDTDNDGVPDKDEDEGFVGNSDEWFDFDKDGVGDNEDTDDDGDGTPDDEDDMPYDANETTDTDSDGIGNNADKDDDNDGYPDDQDDFDLDGKEWLDTDEDGTGNNADTDDDNDGTPDDQDDLPLDSTEQVDTDGDKIGNNADPDDDNDGVADDQDDFPLDDSETTDTDKDGTGDNADTDDDNDGTPDDDDLDPTDPDVSAPQTADVISFMRSSTNLFVGWSDEDNGRTTAQLEQFTLNGDVATVTARYSVGKDGTLTEETSATANEKSTTNYDQVVLSSTGWQGIEDNYVLEIDGSQIKLYPAQLESYIFQIQGTVKTLDGLNISDNGGDLEDILSSTGVYPANSSAALVSMLTLDEKYELDDEKVWFWRGTGDTSQDGQNATSLDDIKATTSSGSTPQTDTIKGVALGYEVGVQLVSDGTANFYTMNWDYSSFNSAGTAPTSTLAGTGTWTQSTISTENIIQFTVPESVQDSWGDKYNLGDTALLSVYDGYVRAGRYMAKNTSMEDDTAFLMNATAKDALLGVVDIPLFVCYDKEREDMSLTVDDFDSAVNECGMAQALTSDMVSGKNFQRVKGNGDTRDYTFNADGTVDVYKNGASEKAYTNNWTISGDYLKVYASDSSFSLDWYWAITDVKDDTWSLLTFEKYIVPDGTVDDSSYVALWATKVTQQDLGTDPVGTCEITEVESGASYQDFLTQLSACSSLPDMDVDEQVNVYRINGDAETRAYILQQGTSSGTFLYFRNGQPRERTWSMNSDGVMEWKDGDTVETYVRLIKELDNGGKLAFYETDGGEIWYTTVNDFTPFSDVQSCGTNDSDWDDENERPVTFTTYSAFESALTSCVDTTERYAKFSADDFLDREVVLEIPDERLTFNTDKSGTLVSLSESTGAVEGTYNFTWSIEDADKGVVKLVISYTDDNNVAQTATEYLAITDTDGVDFAIKGFWMNSAWESESDFTTGGGEIFSNTYRHTNAKSLIDGL
ncbi:hypothetical protein [Vibrio sp. SCSIO 43136]|uniref:hypothetical protein n=1 Tax=Vibrio sp. SCSIO 43136 TaxID=2819101 RepID=UPI0020753FAE|nr:hypothetical protein [Vibrio sp. SCSIO 43136]USD66131.1 hypothetical protein J4N39_04775 [Vibrio sp. SCSIO 43136]